MYRFRLLPIRPLTSTTRMSLFSSSLKSADITSCQTLPRYAKTVVLLSISSQRGESNGLDHWIRLLVQFLSTRLSFYVRDNGVQMTWMRQERSDNVLPVLLGKGCLSHVPPTNFDTGFSIVS